MTILSQAEFDQNSSSGKNSLEKIYQGKPIKRGPVFSLDSLQAAEGYCNGFRDKQEDGICIVVQEQSFIRIWSEVAQEDNQHLTSESSPTQAKTSISTLALTTEFVEVCQKLLAEQIGPIAEMICKKTLNKKPNLSQVEFVGILATKISDITQAEKFKQAALAHILHKVIKG